MRHVGKPGAMRPRCRASPSTQRLPVGYGRWERGARIDSVVPHHFAEVNFGDDGPSRCPTSSFRVCRAGFCTTSYSFNDPTACLPSLRWCPATREEMVRLGRNGLPFRELHLDRSRAGLSGALAQERHMRPVGDVVFGGVVQALVSAAEELLVFLPAGVPGPHAVVTCPRRYTARTNARCERPPRHDRILARRARGGPARSARSRAPDAARPA